jgi:hypothetical protein
MGISEAEIIREDVNVGAAIEGVRFVNPLQVSEKSNDN